MATSNIEADLATAFLLVMFLVWAVGALVSGFGRRRPKNHWTRQRARARRLQTHP